MSSTSRSWASTRPTSTSTGCSRRARRCGDSSRRSSSPRACAARSGSDPTSSWRRSARTPRSPRGSSCSRASRHAPALRARRPGSCPASARRRRRGWSSWGCARSARSPPRPRSCSCERFGPNLGRDIRRRARFEGGGHVGAPRKVVSESRERTFDQDISDPDTLRQTLARMASELCAGLAARGRRGRTIGIKVRLDDFTTVTRARTRARADVRRAARARARVQAARGIRTARPVRLLGVRVAGLSAAAASGEATAGPQPAGSREPERGQLALPL